jgi:hypothetical protein
VPVEKEVVPVEKAPMKAIPFTEISESDNRRNLRRFNRFSFCSHSVALCLHTAISGFILAGKQNSQYRTSPLET